eukprot:919024-Prorocentrum_minimum.AAC.1
MKRTELIPRNERALDYSMGLGGGKTISFKLKLPGKKGGAYPGGVPWLAAAAARRRTVVAARTPPPAGTCGTALLPHAHATNPPTLNNQHLSTNTTPPTRSPTRTNKSQQEPTRAGIVAGVK